MIVRFWVGCGKFAWAVNNDDDDDDDGRVRTVYLVMWASTGEKPVWVAQFFLKCQQSTWCWSTTQEKNKKIPFFASSFEI
jgi:hypothetical protein